MTKHAINVITLYMFEKQYKLCEEFYIGNKLESSQTTTYRVDSIGLVFLGDGIFRCNADYACSASPLLTHALGAFQHGMVADEAIEGSVSGHSPGHCENITHLIQTRRMSTTKKGYTYSAVFFKVQV